MTRYDAKFIWDLHETGSKTMEGNIEMFLREEKVGTIEATPNKIIYHISENFKEKMIRYLFDFLNVDSREVEIYIENGLYIKKDINGTVTRCTAKNDYVNFLLFIKKYAMPCYENVKKIQDTTDEYYALNEEKGIKIYKKKNL
jgi:hypothetical protein